MLKETPASLRAYFGLIAIFALLPVLGQLTAEKPDIVSAIVGMAFGGVYAFVAIRMDHLLCNRPSIIRGVLLLNLGLSGLAAALGLFNGKGWGSLPFVVLVFAITAYLYSSVNRLSVVAVSKIPKKPSQSAPPTLPTGS